MAPKAGLEIGADLKAFRKETQDAMKELRALNEQAIKAATGVRTLEDKTKSAGSALGSFRSGLLQLAAAFGVGGLFTNGVQSVTRFFADFVKGSLQSTSALRELGQQATSIFKDALPKITSQLESMSKATGRAQSELLKMTTDFGMLLDGFGVKGDKLGEMSATLTKLSVDLATFREGMTDEEAFQAFQSGLVTGGKSLKRMGIDLSDTTLETLALNNGFKVKFSTLTDGQKVMLRYAGILEQTADIQGKASGQVGTLAQEQRELDKTMKEISEGSGPLLVGMWATALSVINQVIVQLKEATGWVFAFFEAASHRPAGLNPEADADQARKVAEWNKSHPKAVLGAGVDADTAASGFGPAGSTQSFAELTRQKKIKDAIDQAKAMMGGAGGGGGQSEADKLEKLQKEFTEALSTQAKANQELLKNRREELQLRQKMGVLTATESRELNTINRRLAFQNDLVNDAVKAWDDVNGKLKDANDKVQEWGDKIKDARKDLNQTLLDLDKALKKDLLNNEKEYVKEVAKTIVDAEKELADLLKKPDAANSQARIDELRKVIAQGTDLTQTAKSAPNITLENQSKAAIEAELKGLQMGQQQLEAKTARNAADQQRIQADVSENKRQQAEAQAKLDAVNAEIAKKTGSQGSGIGTQIANATDAERKLQGGTDLDRAAAAKEAADAKAKAETEQKKIDAAQEHDAKVQAFREEEQLAINNRDQIIAAEKVKRQAVLDALAERETSTKTSYLKVEADTDLHIEAMRAKFAELASLNRSIMGIGSAGPAPIKKAGGGAIYGPGGPTSDSIPALLSNGEFVINAMAANMHRPLLERINAMAHPVQRFATGGPVNNQTDSRRYDVNYTFNHAAQSNPALHWFHFRQALR